MTEETRIQEYRHLPLTELYDVARKNSAIIIDVNSTAQEIAIAQHHRGTCERIIKQKHFALKHKGPMPHDQQGS